MAHITKLGMVILMEFDLEAAVAFYKKLGFNLKFHLKDQWAEFDLGDIKIGLCPAPKTDNLIRTGLVFEVGDLEDMFAKLSAEGFPFLNEPVKKIHGIMMSFKDPGNNVIDLYQPTPENLKDLVKKTVEEDTGDCCGSEQGCCKPDA
jgi:predicted enzyme related to lactoylglutathione lyase